MHVAKKEKCQEYQTNRVYYKVRVNLSYVFNADKETAANGYEESKKEMQPKEV